MNSRTHMHLVNIRSTSSNIATGSARDRQHRQHSAVTVPLSTKPQLATRLLRQPARRLLLGILSVVLLRAAAQEKVPAGLTAITSPLLLRLCPARYTEEHRVTQFAWSSLLISEYHICDPYEAWRLQLTHRQRWYREWACSSHRSGPSGKPCGLLKPRRRSS
jgi:hypothetical protein